MTRRSPYAREGALLNAMSDDVGGFFGFLDRHRRVIVLLGVLELVAIVALAALT